MSTNPLSQLYRSKTIYISLPSKGKYYPSGIKLSIDGELGVMPMTARDEILLKSPDALFNGDALIQLLKSCAPDIVNPEETPSCDVDSIILAIKAASKKTVELSVACPHCNKEESYEIDVTKIIATATPIINTNSVTVNNTVINLRPYSLKSQLKTNMQKFHHIRMEKMLIGNDNIPDDQKLELFNKAFNEATQLTMEIITENIVSVVLNDEITVTNQDHIKEWVYNMDKDTYHIIVKAIQDLSESEINNEATVKCPSCDHSFNTIIDLNPVSFFT